MKKLSTRALAVAIAVGSAAGVTVSPVFAKEKQTGPRLGLALVTAAQPADVALQAGDVATAEPLVAQVETLATLDTERYVAAALRYRLESIRLGRGVAGTRQDQTALVRALDALIANPHTPRSDKARFTYQRAQMAYAGRQYPVAIDYLARSRELGLTDGDVALTAVRAKLDSGDVTGATAELDAIIAAQSAAGSKVPVDYYRLAIARANKAQLAPVTVAWMNRYASAYPAVETWYEVLVTYGLQQGGVAQLDPGQKVDVYRLLRASGGLPDEYFYLDYVRTAQAARFPQEAQAVLKEGIAKGRIPAASAEVKGLQVGLTRALAAQGSLASLETRANAAATGTIAAQAADAQLGAGNFAKAATLYRTALQKGGVDADAINTRLGIALARSGDKPGAQAAFALVKTGSRAEIASFWTTWLTTTPSA
jgi:hypothetical protein